MSDVMSPAEARMEEVEPYIAPQPPPPGDEALEGQRLAEAVIEAARGQIEHLPADWRRVDVRIQVVNRDGRARLWADYSLVSDDVEDVGGLGDCDFWIESRDA